MASNTEPVKTTIRPKPLTFEIETQTDEFLDNPLIPLFFPLKTGDDKLTQIEDGDLFDFDVEVQPILNVLSSKILEQARMEVLEEEEISEMNMHQREFERLRNRELEEVQALEKQEKRINEEKERRIKEQKLKREHAVNNQKRLFCRTFAKEYLKKLKTNAIEKLNQKGIFTNVLSEKLFVSVIPEMTTNAERLENEDFSIVNKLNKTFALNHTRKNNKLHSDALQKRRAEIAEMERKRVEEIKRREEHKRRKIEEEIKRKKDQEIAQLRALIETELISHSDYVEDPTEIFDINGYYQKDKKASLVLGGYYGQFALIISYLNKNIQKDLIYEEKLIEILKLFIPKCPTFNLILTEQNLEKYKNIEPSIATAEDIFKLQDDQYV